MCHKDGIAYFGELLEQREFHDEVSGLRFRGGNSKLAILPDIYGLTDFYKGYASFVAAKGADVFLTNPWQPFGELPEPTREAAYERRAKLKDREHCDQLERFLTNTGIEAVVGFCIGGNFAFEMARRGFAGTIVAVYPLPWGMPNDDEITPPFEYMPELGKDVTILMGEADYLAGPENIAKLKDIVAGNPRLSMHLYSGSDHGFFKDVSGSDAVLKKNAEDAIGEVSRILFPGG